MGRVISVLILVTFLIGCISMPSQFSNPVVKTSSGEYKIVNYSSKRSWSRNSALQQANDYCAKMNKQAIIVKESTEYKGIGNEDTNKIIDKVQDATWSLGQYDTARAISSTKSSDDFETTVCFTCE